MINQSGEGAVVVGERFDFSAHKEFLHNTNKLLEDAACKTIVIDLSRTQYMDSAALGMLVQLQKKCQQENKALRVHNAQGAVMDTLEIANMHKLLTIR